MMEPQDPGNRIRILIELQRIELEMRDVKAELAGVDQRLAVLDENSHVARKALEDGRERIAELKKRYRVLEGDSQNCAAQVVKSQEKLRMVKTNKEYQSGLKEVEDLQANVSGVEDEMLTLLEEIDAAESDLVSLRDSVARTTDHTRVQQEEVRRQASLRRQRLESLDLRLAEVRGTVDARLLERYLQVKRGQSDGLALVPVRRAVCQGCNVNIPPQMFNELHRKDSLEHCPNCQRLIYFESPPDKVAADEAG